MYLSSAYSRVVAEDLVLTIINKKDRCHITLEVSKLLRLHLFGGEAKSNGIDRDRGGTQSA